MQVQLLYFASLREALGTGRESVLIPDDVRTTADLRAFLAKRGGQWAAQFANNSSIRTAMNQKLVNDDTAIIDGAEVAFFPPVTGG